VSAAVELPGPDEDAGPATDEERAAWVCDNLGKATWAMEKVRQIALRQKEIEQLTEARVERLQAWASQQIGALQDDRGYFEGQLKRYALARRAADPDDMSVSTPFGKVTTRRAGGSWKVDDDAAAVAALKEVHPELIRESVLLADAKKVLQVADGVVVDPKTGATIPGITPEPSRITAAVNVDLRSA
jgi:predicted oxidoreductase